MNGIDRYLERKRRETALIAGCLSDPPPFDLPDGVQAAIEVKFRLAAALRAERSLQSWTITETARPEVQRWRSGAYEFRFGYQRADLRVRGPSLYEPASVSRVAAREEILYTVSGMGAIAAVLTALVRLHATVEFIAPRGCYNETRELLQSLAPNATVVPPAIHASRGTTTFRVLLLDSCVSSGFDDYRRIPTCDVDLVLFDTTASGGIRPAYVPQSTGRCNRKGRWFSCAAMRSSIRSASNTADSDRSHSSRIRTSGRRLSGSCIGRPKRRSACTGSPRSLLISPRSPVALNTAR